MQIPPVTRTWLTGVVAVTVGVRFHMLPYEALQFHLPLILLRLQVWRLFTCFFYLGPLNFAWLVNLYMMCVGARQLAAWVVGRKGAPFSHTSTLLSHHPLLPHAPPALAAGALAWTMRRTATPLRAARAAAAWRTRRGRWRWAQWACSLAMAGC